MEPLTLTVAKAIIDHMQVSNKLREEMVIRIDPKRYEQIEGLPAFRRLDNGVTFHGVPVEVVWKEEPILEVVDR